MKRNKFFGIFIPKFGSYVWGIFVISLILIIYRFNKLYGGALAILCFIIFLYYFVFSYKRRKEFEKYIETLSFTDGSDVQSTLLKTPLPILVTEATGDIIWYNTLFSNIFAEEDDIDGLVRELVDEVKKKNKKENVSFEKTKEINDRTFNICGLYVKLKKEKYKNMMVMYFIEITDLMKLEQQFNNEKMVTGVIVIDNYDDLMQGLEDKVRPKILAEIDAKIFKWIEGTQSILRKFERDKYMFIFQYKHMDRFNKDKYSILEKIKEINVGNKIPVTLSIGIGLNGDDFLENFENANVALDIALGRGGDQVAIKNRDEMSFIGGVSREHEKRTKVKSRVIAQALIELIEQVEKIMIMGHINSDVDALGAALGIYRIARVKEKRANIVLNESNPSIDAFIKKLNQDKEYDELFLKKNEAIDLIDSKTLLIVVDTHRPSYVECPELLNHSKQIVIIDHHRRATDFIEEPVLVYQETYASSTCELVTEIMQYIGKNVKLPQVEAEAIYAGIVMDTKNFTFKTGVRTFEAAAFLRKHGVDTINVRKMLQNDYNTYVMISDIVKGRVLFKGQYAISVCPEGIKNMQLVTAQAADQLLGLADINAAFVLNKIGENISISGRSLGDINVQLILEKFGGGGHLSIAGAQIQDKSIEEGIEILKKAILEYIQESSKEP